MGFKHEILIGNMKHNLRQIFYTFSHTGTENRSNTLKKHFGNNYCGFSIKNSIDSADQYEKRWDSDVWPKDEGFCGIRTFSKNPSNLICGLPLCWPPTLNGKTMVFPRSKQIFPRTSLHNTCSEKSVSLRDFDRKFSGFFLQIRLFLEGLCFQCVC